MGRPKAGPACGVLLGFWMLSIAWTTTKHVYIAACTHAMLPLVDMASERSEEGEIFMAA